MHLLVLLIGPKYPTQQSTFTRKIMEVLFITNNVRFGSISILWMITSAPPSLICCYWFSPKVSQLNVLGNMKEIQLWYKNINSLMLVPNYKTWCFKNIVYASKARGSFLREKKKIGASILWKTLSYQAHSNTCLSFQAHRNTYPIRNQYLRSLNGNGRISGHKLCIKWV